MPANEETVTLEHAKEQVRKVCVRLGLLHMSFARTIIDELGEQRGKELVLRAIMDYGVKIGERARVQDPQNFKSDLPAYGMIERRSDLLPTEGENESRRVRGHGCVMSEVWREYGETELGRLYCYVDPVKSMAFNPDSVTLHARLGESPQGDWVCEFVTRPTTAQERQDFADRDKTLAWASIEPWARETDVSPKKGKNRKNNTSGRQQR
jgi:hypothetical protein